MTDHAAIAGNYSDFKLVKSRSVAQVIIEVPIEKAEAFLKVFGVPQPGAERPVALALLNPEKPTEQPKPRQSPNMKRVTQAVMLCKDMLFAQWVREHINFDRYDDGEENSRQYILENCKIDSRRELATNDTAWQRMGGIIDGFNRWVGRAAEMRS